MQFLIAADTHGTLTDNNIHAELFRDLIDAVFILGDVSQRDIEILQQNFSVPFFGVGGNHDSWELLAKMGVQDLHTRVVRWKNLTIAGFGGSLRYKETPDYMFFTEQEAIDLLEQMPACDILLTHAAPKYKTDDSIITATEEKGPSLLNRITSLFTKNNTNPYAKHIADSSAPQYKGLYGIGEYIQKHHPNFVLHGHVHASETDWHDNTCVRSFYGLDLFELEI